jgi:heat shock protein HslJ
MGAYIEFNTAESSFGGYTGCNWMGGAVELTGRRMKFVTIGRTKRGCKGRPDPMKLERRYIKYLRRTTRYRQKGPILRLYARNRLLLRFRAMEVPSEGGDRVLSQ